MQRHVAGVLFFFLFSLACPAVADDTAEKPRNIILFVADGAGPAHFTAARALVRHLGLREGLYLDPYLVGTVRTESAKERVTDSASSATSYATGHKTYNGAIGVDTLGRPLVTVLEAAEASGRATGLVASSRITHATPAAFAAHVPDRGMENEIAAQMIEQDVDVILGGGRRHFVPEGEGGARDDGRDLVAEAIDLGYTVVGTGGELADVADGPVMGLFADGHLPYEIDVLSKDHVDLAEMTSKAIELLAGEENGFFLLVEGSRIDHAAHDNDAAASLREAIAYDEAFEVARAFAEANGETLVIAVSDHETGGMSLGRSISQEAPAEAGLRAPSYWQSLYGRGVYEWRPDLLAGVSSSTVQMAEAIERGERPEAVLREAGAVDALTAEETAAIQAAGEAGGGLVIVLGEIIARRAGIGWTSTGHTAVDVNLYAFGPGSESLRGNVDNTQVGAYLFDAFELEMGALENPAPAARP